MSSPEVKEIICRCGHVMQAPKEGYLENLPCPECFRLGEGLWTEIAPDDVNDWG